MGSDLKKLKEEVAAVWAECGLIKTYELEPLGWAELTGLSRQNGMNDTGASTGGFGASVFQGPGGEIVSAS